MWKTVETKAGKVRVTKEERSRKETREEKSKKKEKL